MVNNRDVFQVDPLSRDIPNGGVTKVLVPRTEQEWQVLRYELASFVCDGEYRLGLERILSTYIAHLDQAEQPAAWVSGFYGSGKSHLVRVLEYQWRDVVFPDGASARGITQLPDDINDLLKELTTQGKQHGGLWSAAGTLGAGAGTSVRLAMLGILFRSAGLPEQYAPARLVIWLRQNGYYEQVKAAVEAEDRDFFRELNNMYVSRSLADGLLAANPTFAGSNIEARNLLKAQYPNRDDVSDEELLLTMEDVLALQSTTPGKLPLTLLVFDELQQFIGEDSGRTLQVQTIVEACSARFGSRLLFVATGQAALQATPQLSKLQGRFTVRVTLSDTDVERVVRQVVLRKRENMRSVIQSTLQSVSGEIDRQLAGTKIGPRPTDAADLVPDYPLLPVRRRFWEAVLRAVDRPGTAGQLRTQLRIVHEAARDVANDPVGSVVAGDFIYDQQRQEMLQSGVLLRETDIAISELRKNGDDGQLRSRLCTLIFLISKLPTEGVAATGIEATPSALADLLVEDLVGGSTNLRQRIPNLLNDLVENGTIMQVGNEYRLQTRESAEWEADFRGRQAGIAADDGRIADLRAKEFKAALETTLRGITLTQGINKVPRKYSLAIGTELPSVDSGTIPIWVRDEWNISERSVREDAQTAGSTSPVLYLFIPRQHADALKSALARRTAAKETLGRPQPTSPEGLEARSAMEARVRLEESQVAVLVADIVKGTRVYQGGGTEVNEGSLASSVRTALDASMVRMFPDFGLADVAGWNNVVAQASKGAPDALSAIGYHGDIEKQPVCRAVREYIGGSGKKGSEVRRHFAQPPYGWPQDAIDGAMLALVGSSFVRASHNGQPTTVTKIGRAQIGVTEFYAEGITISALQRIAIRKLLTDAGFLCKAGEEGSVVPRLLDHLKRLADEAGGAPPFPERPSTTLVDRLLSLGGNEQLAAVFDERIQLQDDHKAWTFAKERIAQRKPRWEMIQRLSEYANGQWVMREVKPEIEAIVAGRSLLDDPDPSPQLAAKLATALREALQAARRKLVDVRDREVAELAQTEEWQALDDPTWRKILRNNNLREVEELHVETEQALLDTLEDQPFSLWETWAEAVPVRIQAAREEAVKLLKPKAVRVHPRSTTLSTEDEVESYLRDLRTEILQHVSAGNPVII